MVKTIAGFLVIALFLTATELAGWGTYWLISTSSGHWAYFDNILAFAIGFVTMVVLFIIGVICYLVGDSLLER